MKGKVRKAMVRPAMTSGLEAAPLKKSEEKKIDVVEMKMLRWKWKCRETEEEGPNEGGLTA